MADAASAMEDVNMGDLGAALSAGAAPVGNADGPSGGGFSGNAPHGGAGARSAGPQMQSLDFILDIPLKVTAELGRSKMAVRDILQLAQGSVIELSKFAGEPLEVLVNDKLIARGEVVVVNEKFGIRLTDIISPVERIEQLK
jgi:flagellar motor switch protein FliN/FliY